MRFDRNVPGDGVEAVCSLENGKAFLEWKLHLAADGGEPGQEAAWKEHDGDEGGIGRKRKATGIGPGQAVDEETAAQVSIFVTGEDGRVVLECRQLLREEEPLQSVLLQPRLWRGMEDPYLYHVEAVLTDREGRCRDRVRTRLALRSLHPCQSGGLALNGQALEPRAVRYCLPEEGGGAGVLGQVEKDLGLLLRLGADCVCLEEPWQEEKELCRGFLRLCDELGFLAFGKRKGGSEYVWIQESHIGAERTRREAAAIRGEGEMPILRGRERASCSRQQGQALLQDGERPGPLFYRYLTEWGRQPFVHIVPESVRRMESGNYTALCYSNCDRVALYSDGVLFEFQSGEGEFRFREIPAKTPCIMLSAEGDGCGESLSVHKSFVKQWENKGIWH